MIALAWLEYHGLVVQKQGTFRLCALGAIDEDDIYKFWEVFEESLKSNSIHVPILNNEE